MWPKMKHDNCVWEAGGVTEISRLVCPQTSIQKVHKRDAAQHVKLRESHVLTKAYWASQARAALVPSHHLSDRLVCVLVIRVGGQMPCLRQ